MRARLSRLSALACVPALLLGGPGCGIILGYGTPQPVKVVTNPEGAKVSYNGIPFDESVTPCVLHLHPSKEYTIQAVLGEQKGQGYVKKQIRIPVAVMDGVFTLGIGLLIDYLSGSLYSLTPSVVLNLGKSPPPSGSSASSGSGQKDLAPCPICGEPRGDETPCPYCGMD
ncbi:MAG: hypothetical protein D6731_09265 [Planctomycetota bacterium]|nr:MAG: hypothetical protein D6731_09265 [Planctomycetota bacterium]